MLKTLFENSIILDFDGSVRLSSDVIDRLDLRGQEETFRYYAGFKALEGLWEKIKGAAGRRRVFFLGSGDFHHLSWLIIKNRPEKNIRVIVFDNHPDNMYFPRAIHCGSWVYHASKLQNVESVSVFGVASKDLSGIDLFQNRFSAIKSGKVRYYCLSPVSRLAKRLGGELIKDVSAARDALPELLKKDADGHPVYLSIDKDVLDAKSIKTTWDQGRLTTTELMACIDAVGPRVVGADVTGDISTYNFKSKVKKAARWIDGFDTEPADVETERKRHSELNLRILKALKRIA